MSEPGNIKGEIYYGGDSPQIWIFANDPRWKALCAIVKAGDREAKPRAMTSKYAPGYGRFFNAGQVRGVPVGDAEREIIEKLYAKAKRGWGGAEQ